MANNESKAIFAAGCFWGVEEAFRTLPGVIRTRVGYTGGSVKNPTYEMVSSHTTGHAEALEVTYDPQKISYENLLAKFWQIHDPTQIGGQGPDVGNQYRSEIFYLDQAQREAAQKSQQAEQLKYKKPIATQLTPAGPFYAAEEYHQHYVLKTGKKVC